MALTDGGTRHLHVGVGRLLVGVDGVGEDADEGGDAGNGHGTQ